MKKGSGPHAAWQELKLEAKRRPRVTAVYLILRLIVLVTMVSAILRQEYESVFICLLVLVLFLLPVFLQKKFRFELPDTLEIIILLFIFAAEILGELQCYFVEYPHWDTMLHTTSGFLAAAVGFSLVDLLNRDAKIKFQLSPLYVAIAAFCFAMTVGVLWEFVEFAADRIFLLDMQKDTVVHTISERHARRDRTAISPSSSRTSSPHRSTASTWDLAAISTLASTTRWKICLSALSALSRSASSAIST